MAKIMEASVNLPKATGHTKDASHLKDAVRHVERISDQYPAEKPYDVAIKATPVTCERLPYVPHEDDPLVDAGTARVNIAPTREKPNGTTEGWWAERHADKTVVEQHTVYFDRDNDGIIWPSDTYRGFRDFGWSVPLSLFATFIINVNLSYPTLPSWLPDPRFPIYVKRMYKDKHGSDSMSFDNEGRFRPQSFEDFFAKYDRGNKGGLDKRDIWAAIKGQSMVFDLFGISATMLEWTGVYLLLWPEDGVMRKEDVRGVFDGSIFHKKAEEYAAKQRHAQAQARKKQGSRHARPW